MADPNLRLLKQAAKLLIPVLDELVFVGGCTTGLFITDEGAGDVRPTIDVDAITEITSYADYASFSERLSNSASPKTRAKMRHFAAGFTATPG